MKWTDDKIIQLITLWAARMFVRCFWYNVSQSPSFFPSFLRLVCSLKIGLTFLQLLQHRYQMNPCRLFTFYWYQCALCVSRSLVPVNWYQKPVSVTSALGLGLGLGPCFLFDVKFRQMDHVFAKFASAIFFA